MKHKDAWKVMFKAYEVPPPMSKDRGLHAARPPSPVSFLAITGFSSSQYICGGVLSNCILDQEYVATAERIDCPAPLPEDPAIALLTEMLFLTPYEVPEKKATGTRKGLRRKVVSDSSSEDTEAHSSNNNEEEEEENPLPQTEGEKKRKAAPSGEAEGSKKGRTLPRGHSTIAAYSNEEWLPRDKPLAKS